jgi:(p)ppGpp synthase/HD superfamily hydrolase
MSTLEKAISIAATAHQGQTSKRGNPYVLHPLRLMMKMKTESEKIVAVLHDVVEDTSWTFKKLRKKGFSKEVLEALDCVTGRDGESYGDFIKRLENNPIARKVKIADLEDNMNTQRITEVTPRDLERLKKYHQWWSYLRSRSD